ncbi:hypothetical protein DRA42_08440 [Ethanoligenens harbinense]|nr:hypothetical protein CXQ68_08415 [Ethanoligenens harbinense YUAN-3]AYF38904.1 hypothetical protein CXP51_08285 [Ethanoligenens harbinense]AYF41654.1 hypothetical protein CN246_08430 [Ethanoligenens harbinense]QCN92485.1 hypothetical protein DRA42_08440 [Ethanoligenens harbinense]
MRPLIFFGTIKQKALRESGALFVAARCVMKKRGIFAKKSFTKSRRAGILYRTVFSVCRYLALSTGGWPVWALT